MHERKTMPTQPMLVALTAANLALLSYQSRRVHPYTPPVPPTAADVPAVIRAHALEIVDEHGRLRASLSVLPEDPKKVWKGKPYPETVLLRLITADGRPNVKLGATRLGAGLLIGGESDPTYVQVLAEGGESMVKLINQDSTERVIEP
jgi:hypothetical protein